MRGTVVAAARPPAARRSRGVPELVQAVVDGLVRVLADGGSRFVYSRVEYCGIPAIGLV